MSSIVDVFMALTLEHQIVVVFITLLVGYMCYLMYKTLKQPSLSHIESPVLDTSIDKHLEEAMEKSKENDKDTRVPDRIRFKPLDRPVRKLGTIIKDGVITYTKYGPARQHEAERMARELTVEEAFIGARESFWEVRRNALRDHQPEIYEEIMYWERHLDEYNTYMGMKLVLGLQHKEYDFWVRRGIRCSTEASYKYIYLRD